MKKMWLWVPDKVKNAAGVLVDKWGPPRVIVVNGIPPHPGKVYEVNAESANGARAAVRAATGTEPDEVKDGAGFLAYRAAKRSVQLISGVRCRVEIEKARLELDKKERAKLAKKEVARG